MTHTGQLHTELQLEYKQYGSIFCTLTQNNNANLLVLIPGQSLSPLMFFDFPIYPDGSSIADKILENGFDILYIDPVGYVRGTGMVTPLYTREHLAEQINICLAHYSVGYEKIITSGFCSTTHPPLIACQTTPVDGILILSPIFGDPNYEFSKKYQDLKLKPWKEKDYIFFNSLDNFIKNRLEDRSDSLIGGNHRVPGWELAFKDRLSKLLPNNIPGEWTGVVDMLYDLWIYPAMHGHQGWDVDKLSCPVLCLRGQYDYESNDVRFSQVCSVLGSKAIPVTVKNTSHFGMWENNYTTWSDELITGLNKLLSA
jgi:pimeloyl-ACP methyl ester carboxylesterase